jgi:hypothetical protein
MILPGLVENDAEFEDFLQEHMNDVRESQSREGWFIGEKSDLHKWKVRLSGSEHFEFDLLDGHTNKLLGSFNTAPEFRELLDRFE